MLPPYPPDAGRTWVLSLSLSCRRGSSTCCLHGFGSVARSLGTLGGGVLKGGGKPSLPSFAKDRVRTHRKLTMMDHATLTFLQHQAPKKKTLLSASCLLPFVPIGTHTLLPTKLEA